MFAWLRPAALTVEPSSGQCGRSWPQDLPYAPKKVARASHNVQQTGAGFGPPKVGPVLNGPRVVALDETKRAAPYEPLRKLSNCWVFMLSVLGLDALAVGHFALIHAQAEATFWIGADPSFKNNRRAFLPVIRKWY